MSAKRLSALTQPRPQLPARTLDRKPWNVTMPPESKRPQPRPRGTFPGVLSVPVKR